MNRIFAYLLCAAALLIFCAPLCAFAEEADYGYLAGQKENDARHAVYAQLENHPSTLDRSGYADSHVGGAEDTTVTTQDAEALAEAGVIDAETAERIAAYAQQKHGDISSLYDGLDALSPAQRNEAFASGKRADAAVGDSLKELVEAGVITQEQADAIAAALNP